MKKLITLILLTASFALADDPKPQVDPAQMVVALKAENGYLKERVRILENRLILLNALSSNFDALTQNDAKKPAEQATPVVPKTQP